MKEVEREETAWHSCCPFCTAVQPVLFAALGPAAKGGRQAKSSPEWF